MAQVIVDLDEAVGLDIEVKLGGETYYLPADIPTELMARLSVIFDRWGNTEDDDAQDHLRSLYDAVLTVFRIRHPEIQSAFELADQLEVEEITQDEYNAAPKLSIGARQMGAVVGAIFNAYAELGEENEPGPLAKPSTSASSSGSRPSKGSTAGVRKTGARSAGKS